MRDILAISVPGKPQAWQRAGIQHRRGKPPIIYTPAETRNYKQAITLLAMRAMEGRPPSPYPIVLGCTFCLAVPSRWNKAQRQAALAESRLPTGKPDLDNLAKSVKDALTGVAYVDDGQVVALRLRKVYAPIPSTEITVTELL